MTATLAARTAARKHWRRVRRLTLALLAAWMLLTFGFVFYARELSGLRVFGWPLPFYMAAQGMPLVYLGIIWLYARAMRKLESTAANEEGHD